MESRAAIDKEGQRAMRTLFQEATERFRNTGNASMYVDYLRSELSGGDAANAAGVLFAAAEEQLLSDVLEEMQLPTGLAGLEQLRPMLLSGGFSDSLVNGLYNKLSSVAKQSGQWNYAEAIQSREGKLDPRSEEERQTRLYHEASKLGAYAVFVNTKRLEIGNRDAVGNWVPEPALFALLAESLPTLKIHAERGALNHHLGKKIFADPEIKQALIDLVTALHGEGTAETEDALVAMKAWESSCGTEQRSAEEVLAITSQVFKQHGFTRTTTLH